MERNLNDIIPPSRRRATMGDSVESMSPRVDTFEQAPPAPRERTKQTKASRGVFPYGTALVALVVVLVSAGALYYFSKAKVTVTPVVNEVTADGQYVFVATTGTGTLPFTLITVEKLATKEVKSAGTETVNEAAQGTVLITNAQLVPQQLIKNTRFESADGHIFRIHESVTVPASKNGVAGSLSVTVYADATGEGYNIGAGALTVPGLKGSVAFTQVTAKSSAAMTGGFSGQRPTVPQATKDAEYAALKTGLESSIGEAVTQKIPEGFVLLPGATFVSYVTQPDAPAAGGSVTLGEKAVATAVVFPRAALAQAIAYQHVGSFAGQPVSIANESKLTLTSTNGTGPSASDQEFSFKLAGNVSLLWTVDTKKIAEAVAGKTRQAAEIALTGFSEVDKAHMLLRPFWATSFPTDPSKIDVSVSEPNSTK